MIVFAVVGFSSICKAQSEKVANKSSATFSAAYEFYGRTPYPVNSRGARIGYLVDSQTEIEVTYVRSAKNVLLSDYVFSEYSLLMKNWFSSFAYWGAGIGLREVEIKSTVSVSNSSAEEVQQQAINQKHQAVTANIGFGMEIPITKNILIGSDIFNISAPAYWTKKSNDFPDNAAGDEEDPNTYPFLKDGLRTNFHLLRTYIKVRL